MDDVVPFLPLAVCVMVGFAALILRFRDADADAKDQRADADRIRGINTGLRYDLMATRQLLDGAVDAKRALRRRCRGLLREARHWKREAVARGCARRGAP